MPRAIAALLAVLLTPAASADIVVPPGMVALREGLIRAGVPADGWQRGIAVANPGDSAITVRVGEEWIDVPAHAMRLLSDRTADFSAAEPVQVFGYDIHERSGTIVFTPASAATTSSRRRAVRIPSSAPEPQPQTITVTPSKDNTLFESSNGASSNGKGANLFTGLTANNARRRAVVAFDLSSQIPPGSQVLSVRLTMTVTKALLGPHSVELRRVTADWGEGTSNAGAGSDGTGTTSSTNDATWVHRFFSDRRWSTLGGDFAATADATASVGTGGTVTWGPSTAMTARVQEWVAQPANNFGWLLLGDERASRSAKRFASRENAQSSARPALTIEFIARP